MQTTLANMLLADNRRDEAFTVLEQMAKSNGGRGPAGDIWFNTIKNQPVSPSSVQSLQRFLLIFSSGEAADSARAMLADQQKQMADPVLRAKAEQQVKAEEAEASKPQTWQLYWPLIRKGDAALKANNLAQAEGFYQQARKLDGTDSYAVLGLGDVAMARKDSAGAERRLPASVTSGSHEQQCDSRAGEYLPCAITRTRDRLYQWPFCQPAPQYR